MNNPALSIVSTILIGTVAISNSSNGSSNNYSNGFTTENIYNQAYDDSCCSKTINCSCDESKKELVELLDKFARFEGNWNNNNAKPFSSNLIKKCKELVYMLTVIPEIFPVANNSIQFEFDLPDGTYLKFNIFDDRITSFKASPDGSTDSAEINSLENVVRDVEKAYAQNEK